MTKKQNKRLFVALKKLRGRGKYFKITDKIKYRVKFKL
jgi:hypothetical protein